MTIVIQFQYWDLKVTDTGFEIGLSFSDVPERLEIPFAAVRGFYDPSVNFELEFDVKTEATAEAGEKAAKPPVEIAKAPVAVKKSDAKKKPAAEPAKEEAGRGAARRQGRGRRVARRIPQEVVFRGRRRQPPHGPQAKGARRKGAGCGGEPGGPRPNESRETARPYRG